MADEFVEALLENLELSQDVVTELCTGRLFEEHQALRRQRQAAAIQGNRMAMKHGEVQFQMDPFFYHKFGNKYGYECWDDDDFVHDTLKKSPEAAVRSRTQTIMTGANGVARPKRSFHKSYGEW